MQSSIPITHFAHRKLSAQDASKKTHRGTKEIGSNFFQFVFVEKAWMGAVLYLLRGKKTDQEKELAGMSDSKMYRFAAGMSDGKTYRFCLKVRVTVKRIDFAEGLQT